MASGPHYRQLPSAVAVVSDFASEEARACWEIRGFSLVDKQKGNSMESGPLVKSAGTQFGLRVYWGGKASSQDDQFAIYCFREAEEGADPVKACVTIKVIRQTLPHNYQTNLNRSFPSAKVFPSVGDARVWGWDDFGKLSDLQSPNNGYLVADSLVVELCVKALVSERRQRLPIACGVAGRGSSSGSSSRRLADDFSALLASGQGADVEICGSLGESQEVVRAHRVVMAARSPVFNRMLLASNMRESAADARVNLEGADHAIATCFVRFLYTNELEADLMEDSNALCHLLALAHRYEVQSLLECCTSQLATSLTEESAVERLIMAEQLSIPGLKEHIKEYICSDQARLGQIQLTEAFPRMSKGYPHLLMELFAEAFPPAAKRARPAQDVS